jgi:hypothetical protein
MTLTHILVDYENVQPSAADIALVRGEDLRLAIFRGPGQMKYSADVAEAWQPLGANVSFIHCAKAGRNAVDMHIAFYLGARVATAQGDGGAERARFVIVSKDTDFDPLLMYIRAQGFDATRVSSIKAALGGRGAEPKAEKARAPRAAPVAKAAKAAAAKAPVVKKAAARKAPAKPAKAAAGEKKGGPAERKAAPPAQDASPLADAIDKVIDSLRRMGDRRPAKRAGLERHIESHLGRDLAPGLMQSLMQQLERDGVLAFDDNKVQYRLPKAKK